MYVTAEMVDSDVLVDDAIRCTAELVPAARVAKATGMRRKRRQSPCAGASATSDEEEEDERFYARPQKHSRGPDPEKVLWKTREWVCTKCGTRNTANEERCTRATCQLLYRVVGIVI